jgi:hypothetical protein
MVSHNATSGEPEEYSTFQGSALQVSWAKNQALKEQDRPIAPPDDMAQFVTEVVRLTTPTETIPPRGPLPWLGHEDRIHRKGV